MKDGSGWNPSVKSTKWGPLGGEFGLNKQKNGNGFESRRLKGVLTMAILDSEVKQL